MTEPLPAGATIGILGGGQLGRMLCVAAARLGLRSHIFEPGAHPPAGDVAHANQIYQVPMLRAQDGWLKRDCGGAAALQHNSLICQSA